MIEQQAAGVLDVLELWEKDRVVIRECLDARLAELYAKVSGKLQAHTIWITTIVALTVVVQHSWK